MLATGNILVDDLIRGYREEGIYHEPNKEEEIELDLLKNSYWADCKCGVSSRDFLRYIRRQQDNGDYLDIEAEVWEDVDPRQFGFTGERLWLLHTVVRIHAEPIRPLDFITVDWTAIQYGVEEFPCVRYFPNQ